MPAEPTIIVLHQTSDRFHPGINNVPPRHFFAVLELLAAWGIAPPAVTVTFDDGYADNLPVLEALRRRGIRPMVFIPTETIGKTNRWDYSGRAFPARHLDQKQIRRLADMDVVIGSHGASHRSLTAMSHRRRMAELADSKKTLEDIAGKPVEDVSFPFGRFNDVVVADARACGYGRGFGLSDIAPVSEENRSFVFRRWAVYGNDDYYSLRRRLVGRSRWESFKSRIVWRLAGGTTAVFPPLK